MVVWGLSALGDRFGPATVVALAHRGRCPNGIWLRVTGSRRDWEQWSKSSTA